MNEKIKRKAHVKQSFSLDFLERGTFTEYPKVADGIEGLALFVSDWMAPSAGNADKQQPVGMREKSMISFSVDNVDETFAALKAKGVTFINEPTDMSDWGMRTVYLRDPEENLIELFTPLSREQYSQELLEEDKKFQ